MCLCACVFACVCACACLCVCVWQGLLIKNAPLGSVLPVCQSEHSHVMQITHHTHTHTQASTCAHILREGVFWSTRAITDILKSYEYKKEREGERWKWVEEDERDGRECTGYRDEGGARERGEIWLGREARGSHVFCSFSVCNSLLFSSRGECIREITWKTDD